MNRKWSELTPAQRTGVTIGAIIQIGLMLAAQMDLNRRPVEAVRGPKWVWRFVVLVNFIGPLAYFTCGRRRESDTASREAGVADVRAA